MVWGIITGVVVTLVVLVLMAAVAILIFPPCDLFLFDDEE